MRIFMLGWEFPPFISGGLGTACYGLTQAMSRLGLDVVFALPRLVGQAAESHVKIVCPDLLSDESEDTTEYGTTAGPRRLRFCQLDALALEAYAHPQTQQHVFRPGNVGVETPMSIYAEAISGLVDSTLLTGQYSGDMFAEVYRYAQSAIRLAALECCDIVHAHDWMTFPAGLAVATVKNRPLVVHVHSTEFDRSGEHVHQQIYDIERQGVLKADRVITVSKRMRDVLMERYGVSPDKIDVVYNGVDRNGCLNAKEKVTKGGRSERIVLFLGRITMQKGPEYFLQAAKMVLDHREDVLFVMAGTGDQLNRCIELAAELGIGHRVLFMGFLRGDDVRCIYEMADLYVMPSVSEPFGIAPLEAMDHNVPVLISKQSGVAEVLSHALKVDFWDTREMANKIIAVLRHPPLHRTLRECGVNEITTLSWSGAACRCHQVYEKMLSS